MSTANGVGPYAQNGTFNNPMKKQFSRQSSSFGGGHGHVHNMAVMVVPNKVDYSVTKGGARLWAVLFVFIFLCSAMLTVFTEIDDDDDNHPIHSTTDNNAEDSDDEKIQTTPMMVNDDEDEETRESNPPDPGPLKIIDDEENDDEDDNDEEEKLLAKLKEKAEKAAEKRQMRKMKKEKKIIEKPETVDEIDVGNTPEKQPKKRRKVVKEEEPEVEEEPEEVEPEVKETKVVKQKSRRQRQKVEEEPEKASEPVEEPKKPSEDDKDEIEEDESEPAPTSQPSRHKTKSKKRVGSWRKTVMPDDQALPRKKLLKHQKPKVKQPEENVVEKDDNETDDEENDEKDQEKEEEQRRENEKKMEIKEVTVTKKKGTQYNRKAITNRDDYKHRDKLDTADFLLEKHEFAKAASLYQQVLARHKESPRAHYGLARTLHLRSEFEGNENLLDAAIAEYQIVLDDDDTPETLFRITAENIIECARYRGNLHKVMTVQRALLDRFPDDVTVQNEFGITFLMMNRIEDAKNVFSNVLEHHPSDAMAQAYYGYILKVHDGQLEKGVMYMKRGLRMSSEAIVDAKFYFHLGDALMRLGKNTEAARIYEEATHLGLFPGPLQRSFHNLEGLVSRPWWNLEQTGCGKHLRHIERQWTVIREEAVTLLAAHEALFEAEDSHWTDGIRIAFYLAKDSTFDDKNCELTPSTCTILKKFASETNCFKGEAKISVLHSGSRIWPHCGTTNYILQAQLGLLAPSEARLRVANEVKGWKTGKFFVFDESFEHEIWFDGASSNSKRIVLSMDLWHPEVPISRRSDRQNQN